MTTTRSTNARDRVEITRPPLEIDLFDSLDAAAGAAIDAEGAPHHGAMIALNAEKLVRLYREPGLFDGCQRPIFYPDGVGVLMVTGWNGPRIPGVELWLHVLDRAGAAGARVLVLGARPHVAERVDSMLRDRCPQADIRVIHGYHEREVYGRALAEHAPDVVFVAMGSPRQELLIADLQRSRGEALYMGIGGSLDVLSGFTPRAPRFLRRLNLEFAFRVLRHPTRLSRIGSLVVFVLLAARGRFGVKGGAHQRQRGASSHGAGPEVLGAPGGRSSHGEVRQDGRED